MNRNPHHAREVTVACAGGDSGHLVGIDLRSSTRAHRIFGAHEQGANDVDYNPNKPHQISSGGYDGKVRFWDVRHTAGPLLVLDAHSHWVSCAKYNRFHDQLLLSAGSDAVVNLWRVSSISSSPLLELDDDATERSAPDALVRRFEEHEDSVYAVAWSACDAWIFASLSLDGRVVVNHTPSVEKYRILL